MGDKRAEVGTAPGDLDRMRGIMTEMSRIMAEIAERKEQLVREALLGECPMKGCTARVRTARWIVNLAASPLVERLNLTCDAGHEWYHRFEVRAWDGVVGCHAMRLPMPPDGVPFRAMEQALDAAVGWDAFWCQWCAHWRGGCRCARGFFISMDGANTAGCCGFDEGEEATNG